MDSKNIIVSVVVITYAHEKYICEAIEGVLMQRVDFEMELIVANDNSPDKTDEIVKGFLKNHPLKEKVKYTCHKENKGMMGNFIWALNQCQGKYIALCEGDDFWTDSLKLQKQVDFLESNPEYGLVHTNSKILNQRTQKFTDRVLGKEVSNELDKKELFYAILNGKYIVSTPTALFRKDLFQHVILKEDFPVGDIPLWLQLSQYSKFKFLNEATAVYRVLLNSASRIPNLKKSILHNIRASETVFYVCEVLGFNVPDKFVNRYKSKIFELKKYFNETLVVKYPQYLSKSELEKLNNVYPYFFRCINRLNRYVYYSTFYKKKLLHVFKF